MFTNLHVHSGYSLLDGMCDVNKLVEYVDTIGQTAIAVTDHGVFHAPIKLLTACEDYEKKTGRKIKPIFGIEVYVTPDINDNTTVKEMVEANKLEKKSLKAKLRPLYSKPTKVADCYHYLAQEDPKYFGNSTRQIDETTDFEEKEESNNDVSTYKYGMAHLILLAKDNQGFYNLMQIASDAHLYGFYKKPRTDFEILSKYGKGIIGMSACRAGEIPRLILRNEEEMAKELIEKYKSIFDEFYLELQPPVVPEQLYINNVLIRLAKETNTPLVVTTDAHYIKESEAAAHEDLMKMQTNGKFWFKDRCYFIHTEDEIRAYDFPEEAILNTNLIADKCNVTIDTSVKLPTIKIPDGYTNNSYISYLCNRGLVEYLGKNSELNPVEYQERLMFELNVITTKGLSDYLLIIADILNFCRNNNILIGPGRGSSGGSLVCMCLGITNIDPIKYKLLYERFISLDRPTTPDIDSDIVEFIPYPEQYNFLFKSGRLRTIEYITKTYGQQAICQIVAFGSLQTRVILKDAARALNIDHNEVNDINKFVPSDAGFQWKISECIFGDEEKGKFPIPEIVEFADKYPDLIRTALDLEGNPRHTSIHAAGLVLAPGNVRNYIPLMHGKEDEIVSQWDMKDLEKIGILKIDLLGLKTLGVIDRTNSLIKARHGIDVDYYKIDREDQKALDCMHKGNTKSVFQAESDGMTSVFKKLNTVTFEDIASVLALYRPGPLQYLDSFIKRANKQQPITYLFPGLQPILKDTYGILLYQEQLMKITTDCAGFSKAQSDIYRKVVGKKQVDKIPIYNKWLVEGNKKENIPGLVSNGVDEDKANQLATELTNYAKYSFNRAHAVAYAINTVSTAWYKSHYGLEYMCASLSSRMSDHDKIALYIQDCKNNNLSVIGPCVNHSQYEFTLEGNSIRYGFGAIKGLGYASIDLYLEREQNGLFDNIDDFLDRIKQYKITKKDIDALILSGCLDTFFSEIDDIEIKREALLLTIYEKLEIKEPEKTILKFQESELFSVKNIINESFKQEMIYKSIEKALLGVQFSEHILHNHATPTNWEDDRFDVVVIIKEVISKISKRGTQFLILNVDSLEGEQTIFCFDKVKELQSKLIVNGIRLLTVSGQTKMDGRFYQLKDCKYYREE